MSSGTTESICNNKLINSFTFRYFCAVDEVLTSVQKTEESLRRLKTLREKSASQSVVSVSNSSDKPNVTDDDKIRTQFYVDVVHWSKRIEELGLSKGSIDRLPALISLVNQFSR